MDLISDTSAEIEAMQIEAWRTASLEEKIDMVTALTTAATELAIAGIRYNKPNATIEEERYLLAVRRYGEETAKQLIQPPTNDC